MSAIMADERESRKKKSKEIIITAEIGLEERTQVNFAFTD